MANYLPVLLVSVNTNTIPDDNALTTMPRGQVDYLSHDWQEEDVWRSWRNMTRQKNEITNGIRLENASWRTWWKQRNKLKTISPETLNWLKDSDVTWLYGPLHTAVEWTPPPKPQAIPDSVDSGNPASTHDRLDLHSAPPSAPRRPQPPRTKPILKHRSICELLTSELPVSPVFSPQDSESDSNQTQPLSASREETLEDTEGPKRPALVHTKSDSYITRWGPSRVFRKDSPPRVPPPSPSIIKSSLHHSNSTVRASGAVRNSLSQDSASSASGSSERTSKRKHISFNTFVEQCIAIDKHPRSRKGVRPGLSDYPGQDGLEDEEEDEDDQSYDGKWDDDDGYEEDREDSLFDEDDPLWLAAHGGVHPRRRHLNGSAIHSDSDSDDDAIEIRPSSYRRTDLATPTSKKKPPPRSVSISSSSSATTTSTSASSSSNPPSRQRRKSASYAISDRPLTHLPSPPPHNSAYRPRIPSIQSDPSQRDRVTIAPIAPALLKTTGAWEEGFGDECGASDDGFWDYGVAGHGVNETSGGGSNKKGFGAREEEDQSSEGTPVELVYVPPFGSIYGHGAGTYWRPRGAPDGEEEDDKEEEEAQLTLSNQMPNENSPANDVLGTESHTPYTSNPMESIQSTPTSSIPIVVVDSNITPPRPVGDPFDRVDNIGSVSSSPGSISTPTGPMLIPSGGLHQPEEEREQGRGRDTSVSPVGLAQVSRSITGSSAGLLAPRSRSQSCQDLQSFYTTPPTSSSQQGNERRGRSNQRGSSGSGNGSSSGSRRGLQSSRSSLGQSGRPGGSVSPSSNITSSSSPVGESISPDSSDSRLGGIGNAYAGGRMGGRERERVERVSSSSSLSSKASTAGGGNDERRGRDRGKRVIGSESGSSTSPIPNRASEETRERGRRGMGARTGASLSPQEIFDVEPVPLSQGSATTAEVKGKGKRPNTLADESVGFVSDTTQSVEMDASIYSVSSEGSTATIVPTSPTILPGIPAYATDVPSVSITEQWSGREVMEEAEDRRRTVPTPSNSPIIFMTASQVKRSEDGTATPTPPPPLVLPTSATIPSPSPSSPRTPEHVRTVSASSTHSRNPKSKTSLNVPIVPSPPHPALPSTSASHAPGEVGPSVIFTGFCSNGRSASRSLERASSGSRERNSPSSTATHTASGLRRDITEDLENERELAEARRGRNHVPGAGRANGALNVNVDMHTTAGAGPKEPTSPITSGHKERETIIDKAVGMVSSAGAYLKLWPNHNDA